MAKDMSSETTLVLLSARSSISLASGETLSIHHGVKIFFETDSIANASPASIGMFGFPQSDCALTAFTASSNASHCPMFSLPRH